MAFARAIEIPVPGLTQSQTASSNRIGSLDLLRGLVMIVMALDHVRDFFSATAFRPEDLAQTNVSLFFTRWITHFCAPVFVFLAGTGAYLYGASGRSRADLAKFLLMRGALLLVVELALLNPLWMDTTWFSMGYFAVLQVFWVIGWSMILLAALIWLPTWLIALIGVAMVCGHNTLDVFELPGDGATLQPLQKLWAVVHEGGFFSIWPGFNVLCMYPMVPWPGVMACGFAFGWIVRRPQDERQRWMFALGGLLCAAFIAIRYSTLYGDPHPWVLEPRGSDFTFLGFLNCEKYPPSLCFLLMTLGPAIALLPVLERFHGPIAERIHVYGRVPLFFYVLHIPLISGLAMLYQRMKGWPIGSTFGDGGSFPTGYTPSLPWAYLIWIGIVCALYAPCRWYADVKVRNRASWWAKYF